MSSILALLRDTRLPLWKYCLFASGIALVPTLLIVSAALSLASALGLDMAGMSGPERLITAYELLGLVVFAPVVETFLLGIGVRFISHFVRNEIYVALISAGIWALVHALSGALRFFGVFWGFFVFSTSYQVWRRRSTREAFVAAAVPHALLNLFVAIALAIQNEA